MTTPDVAELASSHDICVCGDYRWQHVNGTGRCNLRELCTPSPCQGFRAYLSQPPKTIGDD
jgi:hypothetical protein